MLTVNKMTINFDGLLAVDDLSFEIEQGEIFCLIGPNGAGKTTCFNMISGLLKPTSGEIWLGGQRIDGMPPYRINRLGIARTYQNLNLFREMTVLENVMVGQHAVTRCGVLDAMLKTRRNREEEASIRSRAVELLEKMQLADKRDLRSDALSYGEQRRLEIARALASNPHLLRLDEPAAGMNPSEKEFLRKIVLQIHEEGVTILLEEHDMTFVMNIASRVCVLNYGKCIALDVPEKVQQDQQVIEAYLGGGN